MKIVVLAGGTSTERDVSLITGKMIYKALKERSHEVVLLDVYTGYPGEINPKEAFTADIDWILPVFNGQAGTSGIAEEAPDLAGYAALRADGGKTFFGPNVMDICLEADIVFIALHGENGEDGKVQATFDLMGIKYTGTDYASSAIAMSKSITKEIFEYYHIPTPKGISFTTGDAYSWNRFPAVVKTSGGGSSVGVYLVNNDAEMQKAVSEASVYGDTVIIEDYIRGREFSIGVIDGHALPIIEIAPKEGFYDYKNKYQAGSTVETCPAELSAETTKAMRSCAESVFKALRLKSYARMDFMMNGKGEFFCLEANTLPGMTPTSLLPQEAAVEGRNFGELCDYLIEVSLKKYQE